MNPEIGHFALVLALILALVQSVVPIIGARSRDQALMSVGTTTALAQFVFVAISFGMLTAAYIESDFSVVNVFENSHSLKPLLYNLIDSFHSLTILCIDSKARDGVERKVSVRTTFAC